MEVLAYVIRFFGDFHEVLFGAGLPIGVVSPEDGSDGAVGEPDGRRTRALGEEDIPCGTRLVSRHEGAIQPEVARYMQALRGCVCADTDVLTQCKGQQQSHQKVLPCLHKRCVLAYDKYTPNFTKSNGARRSGLVGMGEGWAPGRMKGGDRLRKGYALALTHGRGWSPAGEALPINRKLFIGMPEVRGQPVFGAAYVAASAGRMPLGEAKAWRPWRLVWLMAKSGGGKSGGGGGKSGPDYTNSR